MVIEDDSSNGDDDDDHHHAEIFLKTRRNAGLSSSSKNIIGRKTNESTTVRKGESEFSSIQEMGRQKK